MQINVQKKNIPQVVCLSKSLLTFTSENKELMNPMHGTESEVEVLDEVSTDKASKLVLFNDEVNTFDFVIDSLIDVCGHDPIQAEQCTLLVHYTGKCAVKEGQFNVLEPLCTGLLDRGLSAEIH